jgi:hypothetical protein
MCHPAHTLVAGAPAKHIIREKPPIFHVVSTFSQWMLNGCSMGAEWLLHPTSLRQKYKIFLKVRRELRHFQNPLQIYNKNFTYARKCRFFAKDKRKEPA